MSLYKDFLKEKDDSLKEEDYKKEIKETIKSVEKEEKDNYKEEIKEKEEKDIGMSKKIEGEKENKTEDSQNFEKIEEPDFNIPVSNNEEKKEEEKEEENNIEIPDYSKVSKLTSLKKFIIRFLFFIVLFFFIITSTFFIYWTFILEDKNKPFIDIVRDILKIFNITLM